MLSEAVRRLCSLCALSALCTLALPEKRRQGVSLIAGLLCAALMLEITLSIAG